MFIDRNTAVYFDFFRIEFIPQDVLSKIKDKSVMHNIIRIQDDDCIICRFFCNVFIEYMILRKTLLDCTNILSPNDYQRNVNIIYKYFEDNIAKKGKS